MRQKIVSIICFLILLVTSGCLFGDFPFRREIREAKHISNFTVDNNYIYFGAGYKLYRLDPFSQSIEAVYATDRIRVEQPIIADGTAYFGGLSYIDEKGNFGETQGFFAIDLQNRKNLWKFPLGVGGYGTFGTYPILAGDRILVCARQHLHCIDRKSGKELWKLDNWMGRDSDITMIAFIRFISFSDLRFICVYLRPIFLFRRSFSAFTRVQLRIIFRLSGFPQACYVPSVPPILCPAPLS